jgi:hypothetical protein
MVANMVIGARSLIIRVTLKRAEIKTFDLGVKVRRRIDAGEASAVPIGAGARILIAYFGAQRIRTHSNNRSGLLIAPNRLYSQDTLKSDPSSREDVRAQRALRILEKLNDNRNS